MDVRQANDRIAEKAMQMRFVCRVPMLCECSEGCRALVMIRLEDYHAIRRDRAMLTAPGHSAGESRRDRELRSA